MATHFMIFLSVFLLLLGFLTGSFLHFVAIRLLQGESTTSEKSLSRQQCVRAVPFRVKLVTALLFAWAGWMFGWEWETVVALFIISILIVAVQTDLREMIIPNKAIAVGVLCGIALRLFIHDLPLWNYGISFFIGGGLVYIISKLSSFVFKKEAMGGGDVKLFAFVGLMLGFKLLLLSILLASLAGFLMGVVLLLSRRAKLGTYIPYGPNIAVGSLISYGWGHSIIASYLAFVP